MLRLSLHLPDAHSLKDRRAVVRGLKDRLRAHFNVSVAELDAAAAGITPWQRAEIGIAAIAADHAYLEGLLGRAGEAALEILRGERVELGAIEFLD